VVSSVSVNRLPERRVKRDHSRSAAQFRRTEIFKPILRRFNSIKSHFAVTIERDYSRLGAGTKQVAAGVDVAATVAGRLTCVEDIAAHGAEIDSFEGHSEESRSNSRSKTFQIN
jgi:hypothetical protein